MIRFDEAKLGDWLPSSWSSLLCDSRQINRDLYTRLYCILFRGFISLLDVDELRGSYSLARVVIRVDQIIICLRCERKETGVLIVNNYSTRANNWNFSIAIDIRCCKVCSKNVDNSLNS